MSGIFRQNKRPLIINHFRKDKKNMTTTHTIWIDVMQGDRYVCQVAVRHSPLFRLDLDEVRRRLTARCPWLHGADLALTPTDRRTTDAPVIHLRQTTDGQ